MKFGCHVGKFECGPVAGIEIITDRTIRPMACRSKQRPECGQTRPCRQIGKVLCTRSRTNILSKRLSSMSIRTGGSIPSAEQNPKTSSRRFGNPLASQRQIVPRSRGSPAFWCPAWHLSIQPSSRPSTELQRYLISSRANLSLIGIAFLCR